MRNISGVRERLHKVLVQIGSKLWFHGNRKPPLTYNGEYDVSTFFAIVFDPILFILAGNVDTHKISNEFEFRPDRTTDYDIMGKCCLHASSFKFDRIIIKVAGNQDMQKQIGRD